MVRNRLLDIRLSMGYKKQKDFAEMLGISVFQYNRYENNMAQPTLEIAIKISKLLNMNVTDIFDLAEK